jgi:hypothetical protein
MSSDLVCPVCINTYYKEGKKVKSTEVCSFTGCEDLCVKGSDMCPIHNRQRQPIICLACDKSCCRLCYITYFLNEEDDVTKCVHCSKMFDIEFLLGDDHTNKPRFLRSFVWGQLKEHREKVLLDKIMARMPSYQRVASAKIKIDKLTKQCNDIDEEIVRLRNEKYTLQRQMHDQRFIISNLGTAESAEAAKKNSYVTRGKCPKEECNGYIEDKWECGMCSTKVCSTCMLEKKEDHDCNEDDVQSAKFVRDTTKPCPACRTRIYRSEGCDQMWCTNCHVFFSWNTGNLIKQTQWVHNPHFIEFQRRNGLGKIIRGVDRGRGNVGGECWIVDTNAIYNLGLDKKAEKFIASNTRKFAHILDAIQRYVDPMEAKTRDISVKYLNGSVTKGDLSVFIQKYNKASKKEELTNLRRSTYAQTLRDYLTYFHNKVYELNREDWDYVDVKKNFTNECLKQLEEIESYSQDNMENIGKMFNSNPPDLCMNYIDYGARARY